MTGLVKILALSTLTERCRLDVCIATGVVNELQPSGNVEIRTIEGGKFIVFLFKGRTPSLEKCTRKSKETCSVAAR